ncbi:hypothetical protein CIHG_01408 [Coccidioides immitis H538.4]|nr:hypothetical protein CIRG_01259 [Coccidioides immitis RMSCC 2394]KMU74298.1 hypothetical protein CISG_04647 [Coccidioides immitis RMSCC 3703]KMU83625.1 hypothetical protein CIHG_01408 [Coccidioides immitis H538.4]TPX25967.1 hypothetical protein DIZ76_011425 [Coccidioides immitis]
MDIQGVPDWHMFQLPRFLAKEITETYIVWRARGALSKKTLQALMAQFPKQTVYGASTESIFNSGKEWFMRLDFCSAKDGEKGAAPIHILEDIIRALCSSARARRALLDDLDDDEERKPKIFLVPYNRNMNPHREFRVFCPPPTGEISCISQYRWTSPFGVKDPLEQQKIASRILEAAKGIHARIIQQVRETDAWILEKMQEEGFTFDVVYGQAQEVLLVEINPFGAMSGCGSCLYHWLEDARTLYGYNDKVQVRLAI